MARRRGRRHRSGRRSARRARAAGARCRRAGSRRAQARRAARERTPTAIAIRPNGVANTSSPIESTHQGATAARRSPAQSCRIAPAVSRYSSQRMPVRMNSGTPRSVCTHCVVRGVGSGRWKVAGRRPRRGAAERLGHRTEARDVVDVGDGELGHAHADPRDELSGRQRPAAEVEEVGRSARAPACRARSAIAPRARPRRETAPPWRLDTGQRPRKRRPVDLAGGADRKFVDDRQQRHDGRRQSLAPARHARAPGRSPRPRSRRDSRRARERPHRSIARPRPLP